MRASPFLFVLPLLLVPISLRAAPPAAACDAVPVSLPAPLAGWQGASARIAAATASPGPNLALGIAAEVALAPLGSIRWQQAPERTPAEASFGGMLEVEITEQGTYAVALGDATWVDVLAGDRVVASSSHGHGPDCSGIRKIVTFPLEPGRHGVQLSGAAGAQVRILVSRQEDGVPAIPAR